MKKESSACRVIFTDDYTLAGKKSAFICDCFDFVVVEK